MADWAGVHENFLPDRWQTNARRQGLLWNYRLGRQPTGTTATTKRVLTNRTVWSIVTARSALGIFTARSGLGIVTARSVLGMFTAVRRHKGLHKVVQANGARATVVLNIGRTEIATASATVLRQPAKRSAGTMVL